MVGARQDHLPIVDRCNLGTGFGGQHAECFPNFGEAAGHCGNSQQAAAGSREQPFVLALGLRVARLRIFVEAVRNREAAVGEASSFGAEIENRLAVRCRPAPAADNHLQPMLAHAHDGRGIGNPDVFRFEVGNAFRKAELQPLVREELADFVHSLSQLVQIAHRRPANQERCRLTSRFQTYRSGIGGCGPVGSSSVTLSCTPRNRRPIWL